MGKTRGQHYIPVFLLKGFASRSKQGKVWVYYFRRNCAGKEVSVLDVGKETDFNGNPHDSDLEDRMQLVESAFGPYLSRWRRGEFLKEADQEPACRYVTHLLIRTKSLRDGFTGAAQVLVDELAGGLERGAISPLNHPEIENKLIRGIIKENRDLAKFARKNPWRFRACIRNQIAELKEIPAPLLWNRELARLMRDIDVSAIAKAGHIKALTTTQVPELRVEAYQAMSWSLVHTHPVPLILGDLGSVAVERGAVQFINPLTADANNLAMLCCPIGSYYALVGRAAGSECSFSVDEINAATAELSRDFFIAPGFGPKLEELSKEIGKRANLMTPEELRIISGDAIRSAESE